MHAFGTKKKSLYVKALFEQRTLHACFTREPNNYTTFVILTAAYCIHAFMTLVTRRLHGPTAHANIGESLPPCGGR